MTAEATNNNVPPRSYRVVTDDPVLAEFLGEVADAYTEALAKVAGETPSHSGLLRLMLIDMGHMSHSSVCEIPFKLSHLTSCAAACGLLARYHGVTK